MKIIYDNCLNWLKEQESNSIHLFLTDPPYGLEFMGKKYDNLNKKYNEVLDRFNYLLEDTNIDDFEEEYEDYKQNVDEIFDTLHKDK